jgi:carbamoyl-phosphate synthase large subunit
MERKNILMSGAGGSGTIALIKELSKNQLYNLVVVDADRYAVGLYLCENSYVVPFVKELNYKNVIREIIERHSIDVYIPLIDEEIEVAYDIQQYYPKMHLLVPDKKFCNDMLNKWIMFNIFTENDLPVPYTQLLGSKEKLQFTTPKIVKPIVGRGSRGVQIVNSLEELEAYLVLSKYKAEELILQEYIQGTEYTVSVVVNKSGKVLAVVPKRIVRKKGITQIAVTENNAIITQLCNELQKKLKANGPFNVQLMMVDDKPYVFEVNPRFSTSVVLTMAAGINEVDVLLKDSLNIPYSINDYKSGVIMSRFYEQKFLMDTEVK